MKKGMCVTLDNNVSYNLVDSVTYSNEKFFAATNDESDELFFFKHVIDNQEEFLEPIDSEDYPEVIDALLQHIQNTFNN